MSDQRKNIQFCGFGGQGIVLSSVILGSAAVTHSGYNGVQTQSYGSEARGGECQAELIISKEEINSPLADEVDLLVAMSQPALDRYIGKLRSGGYLIIDPELVEPPKREDVVIIEVPATQVAKEIGQKIVANMVMLGFIQSSTELITEEALLGTIKENVAEKFLEVDLQAVRQGMKLAKEKGTKIKV